MTGEGTSIAEIGRHCYMTEKLKKYLLPLLGIKLTRIFKKLLFILSYSRCLFTLLFFNDLGLCICECRREYYRVSCFSMSRGTNMILLEAAKEPFRWFLLFRQTFFKGKIRWLFPLQFLWCSRKCR